MGKLNFFFFVFRNNLSSVDNLLLRRLASNRLQIQVAVKILHETHVSTNCGGYDFKTFRKHFDHGLKAVFV